MFTHCFHAFGSICEFVLKCKKFYRIDTRCTTSVNKIEVKMLVASAAMDLAEAWMGELKYGCKTWSKGLFSPFPKKGKTEQKEYSLYKVFLS